MFPATFLNFGPACSAIFLLWSFGEINQLELSIYLDIYAVIYNQMFLGITVILLKQIRFLTKRNFTNFIARVYWKMFTNIY